VRLFSGLLLRIAGYRQKDENPDPSATGRGTTAGEPSSAHRHQAPGLFGWMRFTRAEREDRRGAYIGTGIGSKSSRERSGRYGLKRLEPPVLTACRSEMRGARHVG